MRKTNKTPNKKVSTDFKTKRKEKGMQLLPGNFKRNRIKISSAHVTSISTGDEEHIESLLSSLHHPNHHKRLHVMNTICNSALKENRELFRFLPRLAISLCDESEDVRQKCLSVINQIFTSPGCCTLMLRPFTERLFSHVCMAMSHISQGIRDTAMEFVQRFLATIGSPLIDCISLYDCERISILLMGSISSIDATPVTCRTILRLSKNMLKIFIERRELGDPFIITTNSSRIIDNNSFVLKHAVLLLEKVTKSNLTFSDISILEFISTLLSFTSSEVLSSGLMQFIAKDVVSEVSEVRCLLSEYVLRTKNGENFCVTLKQTTSLSISTRVKRMILIVNILLRHSYFILSSPFHVKNNMKSLSSTHILTTLFLCADFILLITTSTLRRHQDTKWDPHHEINDHTTNFIEEIENMLSILISCAAFFEQKSSKKENINNLFSKSKIEAVNHDYSIIEENGLSPNNENDGVRIEDTVFCIINELIYLTHKSTTLIQRDLGSIDRTGTRTKQRISPMKEEKTYSVTNLGTKVGDYKNEVNKNKLTNKVFTKSQKIYIKKTMTMSFSEIGEHMVRTGTNHNIETSDDTLTTDEGEVKQIQKDTNSKRRILSSINNTSVHESDTIGNENEQLTDERETRALPVILLPKVWKFLCGNYGISCNSRIVRIRTLFSLSKFRISVCYSCVDMWNDLNKMVRKEIVIYNAIFKRQKGELHDIPDTHSDYTKSHYDKIVYLITTLDVFLGYLTFTISSSSSISSRDSELIVPLFGKMLSSISQMLQEGKRKEKNATLRFVLSFNLLASSILRVIRCLRYIRITEDIELTILRIFRDRNNIYQQCSVSVSIVSCIGTSIITELLRWKDCNENLKTIDDVSGEEPRKFLCESDDKEKEKELKEERMKNAERKCRLWKTLYFMSDVSNKNTLMNCYIPSEIKKVLCEENTI